MADESKELTLRVHDECVSVYKLSNLELITLSVIQVTGLMSSAPTFVRANHT